MKSKERRKKQFDRGMEMGQNQSPAAVVTRSASDQSFKSSSYSYFNQKQQEMEAKPDDQRQNEKEKSQ